MEKSSNKTNKLLLVLVIVLSIVVLVETTLLCSTLLVKKDVPKKELNNEIVDKEVKDIDDITDLSIKIDTLLSQKTNNYYKSNLTSAYGYRFQVLKGNLTSEVKHEILLDNIEWEDIPSSSYEILKETEFFKNLINSGYEAKYLLTTTKQVSLEKLSNYSEKLFGEKITNPVKSINTCPMYTYIEETKSFYYPIPQCGGINPHYVATYKSKYVDLGNEIDVYVNVAHLVSSGTQSVIDKYTVYKDFDLRGEAKFNDAIYKDAFKSNLSQQEAENFEITEDNHKEFSEYKFKFKKDQNNNYYFVSVEQVK